MAHPSVRPISHTVFNALESCMFFPCDTHGRYDRSVASISGTPEARSTAHERGGAHAIAGMASHGARGINDASGVTRKPPQGVKGTIAHTPRTRARKPFDLNGLARAAPERQRLPRL